MVPQRVGITTPGGRDMPRTRQIGLTEDLKRKVLHIDRLTPEVRKNVTYDVRMIIEKEFEDLEWFFKEAPDAFRRSRDRTFLRPLEAVMPQDPKRIRAIIRKLEDWEKAVRQVKEAVSMMGLRFLRTGRF